MLIANQRRCKGKKSIRRTVLMKINLRASANTRRCLDYIDQNDYRNQPYNDLHLNSSS